MNFEKDLTERLRAIFKFDLVKLDQLSDINQQEILFVTINRTRPMFRDGKYEAMVEGFCEVVLPRTKCPPGYFGQMISLADASLTRPFFFFELESEEKVFQNVVKRGFSFQYKFLSEFNLQRGIIDELETTMEFQT